MAEQVTPVVAQRPKILKIERRAWLRFPNEQEIICWPVTGRPQNEPELAWLGKIRDISAAGIGLSMSRRFERGAELIVEMSAERKAALLLPVRVIHATLDEKDQWIIGCEFIFPLSEKDLQSCLRETRADR